MASFGRKLKRIAKGITRKAGIIGPSGPMVDKRHRYDSDDWLEDHDGKWVRVHSSNVQSIMYDVDDKALYVQFLPKSKKAKSSMYAYWGVHSSVAKAMFDAASVGKFVHKRLKGHYAYSRLE
jgi:hypothetical protein